MSKLVTQSDIRKAFKSRAKKAVEKLPHGWINAFISKYYPKEKEVAKLKIRINNVTNGLSYDEGITLNIENFVELLKPGK